MTPLHRDGSIALRMRHRLTAYHWRRDNLSDCGTVIGICSCGWKARFIRKIEWTTRWRMVTQLCWLRGHDWDDWDEVHAGPVGFEESPETLLGVSRQCERCYSMQDKGFR